MSAQTKVEKWEIAGSFPHMAGDIFLTQTPNGFLPRLAVTLRFRAKDLRLVFERAVGYTWKNDSWVGFSFAADSSEFPRFVAEGPGRQWRFIYPLLEVKDSAWAAQYTICLARRLIASRSKLIVERVVTLIPVQNATVNALCRDGRPQMAAVAILSATA